jgi:hypothetical protein
MYHYAEHVRDGQEMLSVSTSQMTPVTTSVKDMHSAVRVLLLFTELLTPRFLD